MRAVRPPNAARLVSSNPKFHPGADPIQREAGINVIMPTDKQQIEQMIKLLEKEFGNGDPLKRQALELFKMNVAQETVSDQVKLEFLKRFHFWLLGRGDEEDHKKTLWGRGNAAVYNPEVAAYIDMFIDKRKKWVMKLLSLANNVPDTLLGYYLYFKYIVNGGLAQKKTPDGYVIWDMSDEDYLQDFDVFQQVFEPRGNDKRAGEVGYSDLAGGLRVAPFGKGGVPGPVNQESMATRKGKELAEQVSISKKKLEQRDEEALNKTLDPTHAKVSSDGSSFFASRSSLAATKIPKDPQAPAGVTNITNTSSTETGPGSASLEVQAQEGGTLNDVSTDVLKNELREQREQLLMMLNNHEISDDEYDAQVRAIDELWARYVAKKLPPGTPPSKMVAKEPPGTPLSELRVEQDVSIIADAIAEIEAALKNTKPGDMTQEQKERLEAKRSRLYGQLDSAAAKAELKYGDPIEKPPGEVSTLDSPAKTKTFKELSTAESYKFITTRQNDPAVKAYLEHAKELTEVQKEYWKLEDRGRKKALTPQEQERYDTLRARIKELNVQGVQIDRDMDEAVRRFFAASDKGKEEASE